MDKMNNRTDKRAIQIIKLTGNCKLWIFALTILQLTGCVKDDLHDTPHPDRGAVKVTTDWTGRSSDAVVPDSYILRTGGNEWTVSGETNSVNALFAPGRQELLVYHRTEGISIDGNIATVNTRADGTLEPMPGFLFSAAKTLEIVKDDTVKVTLPMRQRIRTLTLVLNLKPGEELRLGAAAATLTGIASAIDLTTGTLQATAGKKLVPVFAIGTNHGGTRAASTPALMATVRLPGVATGEKQLLTLILTLTDGSVHTLTTDLTEMLKNFGHADMEPLLLDATLELPVAPGVGGTISGWNVVDNGDIEIN